MNENTKQQDNTQYLQDEVDEQGYSGMNDDDSYYSDEEFIDEDYENEEEEYENNSSGSSNKGIIAIIAILIVILVFILLLIGVKLISKGNSNTTNSNAPEVPEIETQVPETSGDFVENITLNEEETPLNTSQEDVFNVDFGNNGEAAVVTDVNNDNSGQDASIATVTNVSPDEAAKPDDLFGADFIKPSNQTETFEQQEEAIETPTKNDSNNSIMVAWNKNVRQNPFKPSESVLIAKPKNEKIGDFQFEIIEPPTKLVPDQNLTKLLQTQISGILYDDISPSAIVNFAGKDQFVKIGDEVSGYKIQNITRTKVEISYKNNNYVASVGELFVPGSLEKQSDVVNLSSKFAGRYKNQN